MKDILWGLAIFCATIAIIASCGMEPPGTTYPEQPVMRVTCSHVAAVDMEVLNGALYVLCSNGIIERVEVTR